MTQMTENQRNVKALTELLEKIQDAESNDFRPGDPEWMARCLAGAGVLVPSALTEDDVQSEAFLDALIDLHSADDDPTAYLPVALAQFKERLERIAKGEKVPA